MVERILFSLSLGLAFAYAVLACCAVVYFRSL
jgi:hypothetical protein